MNERISPKRQAAELAFAKITEQQLTLTRAQAEQQIAAAERQSKTAKLRAERLAREYFDLTN